LIHIEAKIISLGYKLPVIPPTPKGNYINYTKYGNLLFISGHLPQPVDGPLITGRLGENLSIEEGKVAARLAALQICASIKAACGDLDKVKKVLKLTGFISSTNDFTSQATVMNGCSDFFGEVFGLEIGQHSRSALGVNILPLNVPVEIEAVIEIEN
jgi:enamine deaminase RidA (YjgF/YER057c/UK114 family)